MFVKSKDYEKFLIKVRVNIGKELGLENENEAFIELKEIPTLETMNLKEMTSKSEKELIQYFKNMLPMIIVDHNLYVSENIKMSNEEVVEIVFEKNTLATKVIGDYLQNAFFTSAPKKGEKSKA